MGRSYSVKDGKINILDVKQTVLGVKDIEFQLQAIAREKSKLMEQNQAIVNRYKGLQVEEQELKDMIIQVEPEILEIISPETGTVVRETGEENV